MPIERPGGKTLGYIQVSEGPAYGGQIVDSVALGWAVAGVVAVLLAVGVGLIISRRISAPLVSLTDVTERMAAGDLSARASVMRRDELGTLATAFNDMAARVEETVMALRHFVGDAAHELHTPLTALRTNLELIADEQDKGERENFICQAQAQMDRLQALSGGLLDLSRLDAATASGSHMRTAIDLTALVQGVSELYASRAEQDGLGFELDVPPVPMMVCGDEVQLQRALSNLLDNALKFTPKGGTVRTHLQSRDGVVQVLIEDNGIGIPTGDMPRLFNRFHRGRNAAVYPGSGLGLAIVKAIVEGHDGTVTAERLDPGTRFVMTLPALHASTC
jgi:signal transduction histidine kinase